MQTFRAAVATAPRGGITNRCTTKKGGPMPPHRTPSQTLIENDLEDYSSKPSSPRSLLLLIELMLTTYDRRSAQCGQACTGKARHHNQIARLGHVAARGLGSCSRRGRGGHRFGVIFALGPGCQHRSCRRLRTVSFRPRPCSCPSPQIQTSYPRPSSVRTCRSSPQS